MPYPKSNIKIRSYRIFLGNMTDDEKKIFIEAVGNAVQTIRGKMPLRTAAEQICMPFSSLSEVERGRRELRASEERGLIDLFNLPRDYFQKKGEAAIAKAHGQLVYTTKTIPDKAIDNLRAHFEETAKALNVSPDALLDHLRDTLERDFVPT